MANCNEIPDVPPVDFVTATDNCDNDIEITFIENIENNDCGQTITRIWTATDNCGNATTATQTISVGDDGAPVITGVPADITAVCGDIEEVTGVTVEDDCDADIQLTLTEEQVDGDCANNFTLTRTWTATDACGNTTISTQTVIVLDNESPVLEGVPADVEASCDEIPTVPSADIVIATDNCDDNIIVDFTENIENNDCGQTITRTWTATDACGNSTESTQIISVGDTELPVFANVPNDMTVPCGTPLPDMSDLDIEVTDNCDDDIEIIFTEENISGDCAGEYQVIMTMTATDDCGNEATASFTMTVIDEIAPVFTVVPENISAGCSVNPDLPSADELIAVDDCDNEVEITLEEITEENDCGVIITRVWTATDACGNATTASQIITLGDDGAPVFADIPADVTVECDNIPDAAELIADDVCDSDIPILFSDVITPGDCNDSYLITRTWTATDDCGNTTSAQQILNVLDTTAPIFDNIPADVEAGCDEIPEVPDLEDITATDNCDQNVEVTFAENIENNDCGQIITRTWTATDNCGNAITATQTINVGDNGLPTLVDVPADITVECDNIPTAANLTVEDDCDSDIPVLFSDVITPGDCDDSYIITRTWTATDVCGNTTSAQQMRLIVVMKM